MTVVTLVYLGGSGRSGKEVEAAAREVASAIRETQNNALGGKQPVAGVCGHGFYFNATENSTAYKIFYNLKPAGEDCSAALKNYNSSGVYITYSLQNGVRFDTGSSGTIYFDIPHANIYYENNLLVAPLVATIPLRKGASTYNVCVYPSGNVIESKTGC